MRCFDNEMVMVVHQAIGVAEPIIADSNALEGIEECLTVMIIAKYGFPLIPPTGDMIYGSWKLYS
jgi:hypothetical protein